MSAFNKTDDFKFGNGVWTNGLEGKIEVTEDGRFAACINGLKTIFRSLEDAKATFDPAREFKEKVRLAVEKVSCDKRFAAQRGIEYWCAAHRIGSPFEAVILEDEAKVEEFTIKSAAYLTFAGYTLNLDRIFKEINK